MELRKNTLVLDRVTQLSLFINYYLLIIITFEDIIYKRIGYGAQQTRRRNFNKNISVPWNMVKNTINISEEGEENDSRDSANDLLPCSEAFE